MGTEKIPAVADGATCRVEGEATVNVLRHGANVKRRLAEYLKAKGIEPDRYGMIHCPWHDDQRASCKLNADYLYCFSCGESGDIYKVAASIIGVPCDKEHFREAANDVEQALGIPKWEPPKRTGSSRFRLSQSAVYRRELLREFGAAVDAGDEERAFFRGTLLLALDKLSEAL